MNCGTDNYYYSKKWFVIKSCNKYFTWNTRMVNSWMDYTAIRKNLNYFESVKLVKVLNKLHGK